MILRLFLTISILAILAFSNAGATNAAPGYYVQVTDLGTGQTFWANAVSARAMSVCEDQDHGFNPTFHGQIHVVNMQQTIDRILQEKVLAGGRIREYACGNEILIDGVNVQPTWAIGFDYTLGE